MKYRFVSFCMALVALIAFTHCPVYAVEKEQDPKGTYLALGDSISTGFGLEDPDEQGFVNLVAKQLELEPVNEAVVASTSDDVLRKLKKGRLDDEIENASLITITCGGNDLMNALYDEIAAAYNEDHQTQYTGNDVFDAFDGSHEELGASDLMTVALPLLPKLPQLPEFEKALASYRQTMFGEGGVIDYLRSLNESVAIFVAKQYNPYQSVGGLFAILNTSIDLGARVLNEAISENAAAAGCYVSDVYGAFSKYEENLCNCRLSLGEMNFDFHPNATGHRVIADTVLDSYRALQFGLAGYQTGTESLRLVGYVNTVYYDSLEVQIDLSGTQNLQKTVSVNTVCRTMCGVTEGELRAVVSCDGQTDAPHKLPHAYLFGCVIDALSQGTYTLTAIPVAVKDGMTLQASAVRMQIEVLANGQITILSKETT